MIEGFLILNAIFKDDKQRKDLTLKELAYCDETVTEYVSCLAYPKS